MQFDVLCPICGEHSNTSNLSHDKNSRAQ